MFGKELTEQVPFTDVNIHSVIQAPDGRRMSKSLGTGIDPSDLIHGGARPPVYEEGGEFPAYGADALRFGLLAMSSSQDVRFNEERVKQGRDLANKLWNAARLILLRVADVEPDAGAGSAVEDRWIVSRLERLTERVTELYDEFRFSFAALELYGGLLVRARRLVPRAREAAPVRGGERRGLGGAPVVARAHPAAAPPGDAVRDRGDLVAHAGRGARAARGGRVPRRRPSRFDEDAERELARMIEAVTALRRYRDEVGAKPSAAVRGHLAAEGYDACAAHVARLARFEWVDGADADGDVVATVPIPGGGVQVLPSDAFDAGEAQRAGREEARRARPRRSSGPSGSSRTSSSWRRRRRRWWTRSAASSAEYREALAQARSA